MKMRYYIVSAVAAVLGLGMAVALVSMVGCDTPSTGEPENYFDENPYSSIPREEPGDPELVITPAGYAVTNNSQVGQALLFSAKGGREPITWELVNTEAGSIEVQGNGRDAIYTVEALKPNTIIARDGAGAAALASIRGQDAPSLSIASSDDPELVYDSERILLYAVGGTPPFDWRLVYPQRGQIVHHGAGDTFIEYMRVTEPDQVVILRDANDAMAELRISQPDETEVPDDGGTPTTPLVATATPSTLSEDYDLAVCVATGGTPPYTWRVIGITGAIVSPATDPIVGPQVVYERGNEGDNALSVTDSAGNTTYLIISQPPVP